MRINSLEEMRAKARELGPKVMAVAAAHDAEVLIAAEEAWREGLARGFLIGDASRIEAIAREKGLDLAAMSVIHEPDPLRAAQRAVALAREGQADMVVKGQLKTDEILHTALDRERGIRRDKLMVHVGIFQVPGFDRLLYISDTGVVLYPTVEQKLEILRAAVEVAHRFGLEEPRVAILAATEEVHPKIPASVDALALAKMAEQGWVEGALVDGPLSLDVAVSPEAARIKGIGGPVAGHADVLIVPDVEAGNTMAKAMLYLAHARMAGVVIGGQVPILINSRADTHETRLFSIAMAVLLS